MTHNDTTTATQHLVRMGKVQEADVARASEIAAGRNATLNTMLVRLGLVSEKDLAACLAELHHLPLLAEGELPDVPVELSDVSTHFLRLAGVLPLTVTDALCTIAVVDPEDTYTSDALKLATGKQLELRIAPVSQLERAFERLYGSDNAALDQHAKGHVSESADSHAIESTERLRDMASEAPIVRMVNQIINRAVESRASDIHIEPYENRLDVRYRIDGVLQDRESPPAQASAAILSRMKLMAKLNIAERRLPQDGRIQIQSHGKTIDLRVSTVPTLHGESLVLRLLDKEQVTLDFTSLGFSPRLQQKHQQSG